MLEGSKMAKTLRFRPPARLSEDGRKEWIRIIRARETAGRPVEEIELSTLGDLCDCRDRIAILREYFHQFGTVDTSENAAAVNAATALARRLSKDLGVGGGS